MNERDAKVKIMQEIRGEKIKMIIVVGKISEDD
jgi:hypothetical protein